MVEDKRKWRDAIMNEKEKQLDLIINKNNLLLKQNVMFDRVVEERF